MELFSFFVNKELHIGHATSSIPGDVIARYHTLIVNKNDNFKLYLVFTYKEAKLYQNIKDLCKR